MNRNLERKNKEQQMRSAGRLPPGQALTLKFPVLHYGSVPGFDTGSWDFRVYGEVEKEVRWTCGEFQKLPTTQIEIDIHCVTRWSKFGTLWEGVSVRHLMDMGIIKLRPETKYVIQHADYGYTTNLPLELVLQDSFVLATQYDRKPIDPDHGYPVRGVIGHIPGRSDLKTPYLWKGAKWLRALEFTAHDRPGFWEKAGYHNDADVWDEERFR